MSQYDNIVNDRRHISRMIDIYATCTWEIRKGKKRRSIKINETHKLEKEHFY